MWVILEYLICFWACCSVVASHDASTVTAMLAKLGLGPLAHCYGTSTSGAGGEEPLEDSCLQFDLERSLPKCWGYEKNCTNEESLFVPQCEPPAQPWWVNNNY